MSDRKTLAIALGTVVGVAAVAACVGLYVNKSCCSEPEDVNDVFEKAKQTVKKLDDAVDLLRKSTAA